VLRGKLLHPPYCQVKLLLCVLGDEIACLWQGRGEGGGGCQRAELNDTCALPLCYASSAVIHSIPELHFYGQFRLIFIVLNWSLTLSKEKRLRECENGTLKRITKGEVRLEKIAQLGT
jgi:hypothetical protein